jgi:predicted methyltransferase
MKRSLIVAAALAALFAAGPAFAAAHKMPAYVAAAIADKNRPDADTARDADRKPAEMVMFAGIKPGMRVVDFIPGRGYFTRIFAGVVGPKGWVYAFFPTQLDGVLASNKVTVPTSLPGYPNVSYVHANAETFPIPEKVDVVWTSQNYHDEHDKFMGPVDLAKANKAIFDALKPGGIFLVLDHAAQAGSGLRDTDTLHRIDPAVVKSEVEAAGFKFVGESSVLRNKADDHSKLVFDKSIRGHTDQFIYKFRKPGK